MTDYDFRVWDHIPSKDANNFYYSFMLDVIPWIVENQLYSKITEEQEDELLEEAYVMQRSFACNFSYGFDTHDADHVLPGGFVVDSPWCPIDWFVRHRAEIYEILDFLEDHSFIADANHCRLRIKVNKLPFGEFADHAAALMADFIDTAWDGFRVFARRSIYSDHLRPNLPCRLTDRFELAEISKVTKYLHKDVSGTVNCRDRNYISVGPWQGTLDIATLMATLELTSNLTEWAKQTSRIKPDIKQYNLNYLRDFKQYEDLTNYLNDDRFKNCAFVRTSRKAAG
jgi:hypothetical protein